MARTPKNPDTQLAFDLFGLEDEWARESDPTIESVELIQTDTGESVSEVTVSVTRATLTPTRAGIIAEPVSSNDLIGEHADEQLPGERRPDPRATDQRPGGSDPAAVVDGRTDGRVDGRPGGWAEREATPTAIPATSGRTDLDVGVRADGGTTQPRLTDGGSGLHGDLGRVPDRDPGWGTGIVQGSVRDGRTDHSDVLSPASSGSAAATSEDDRRTVQPDPTRNSGSGRRRVERRNFGSRAQRAIAGVDAAETLRALVSDGRNPTERELDVLAAWPGWGGIPEVLDDKKTTFSAERERLKDLWDETQWRQARRTVLNAHYTDPELVDSMWTLLERLGVPADATVLEPGCGSGNFIAAAPEATRMVGVELDSTTAQIAGLLNPDAQIVNESFAQTTLRDEWNDGFDAVIGNVPFADVSLHDPAYNPGGHSMHNHFIIKSLRMTKPGGIVAVLTSRYSLDSKSSDAREEMNNLGQLIGAVRLPNGAHRATAGTEVITDLLVFRRRQDGEVVGERPAWVETEEVEVDGFPIRVNSYFTREHPELLLGELKARSGRFGPEPFVSLPVASIPAAFARATTLIGDAATTANQVWAANGQVVTDRPVARISQEQRNLIGSISLSDEGGFELVTMNGVETLSVPVKDQSELAALLSLRDVTVNLLTIEASTNVDTSEMDALRGRLNREYAAYVESYGALNRVNATATQKLDDNGEFIVRRSFPTATRMLRTDPHFATVMALEIFDEDSGNVEPAAIMHGRVVGAVTEVTSVDTPAEAIALSVDRHGQVRLDYVAELLGVEEAQVTTQLAGLIFHDPAKDQYVSKAEYLSGPVRRKLEEACTAAEQSPERYAGNVEALTSVVPAEVGPAEINVTLNNPWVPTDVMRQWVRDLLGRELREFERVNGEFKFKITGKLSDADEAKWSISGDHVSRSATVVIGDALNGKDPKVTYSIPPESRRYLDQAATEALAERLEGLNGHFADWLWEDADRADAMQKLYNDLYNGTVLRNYDDVQLTFPGKAATFTPRPHQVAAVARMIAEPSTLLAHSVGAGKTAEMVMGTMELRRLGLASKPAVVVPNHMLEQFTREFKQIYPTAQLLAASSDDLAKKNDNDGRRLFTARAATGDWDAIIMTQSAFQRLGMREGQEAYLRAEMARVETMLANRQASTQFAQSLKTVEKALLSAETTLQKQLAIDHDPGLSFEETGIDYLCVDEAHMYKNLNVTTTIQDLQITGSNRARDLDMKLWYLREHKGRAHVATFATGTPVANNLIELYTMQRYLRPDLLQAAQLDTADAWAAQFTEQAASVEMVVEGGKFQVKTRTLKFRNLPELMQIWGTVADVKTAADLQLPIPNQTPNHDGELAPTIVEVPATSDQAALMKDLIERAERVRGGGVPPETDNLLKISNDGRHLALDARLRGGDDPQSGESSKLQEAASRIVNIWEASRDTTYLDETGHPHPRPGSLQIVFSDLGTPKPGQWNVYDGLRNELVQRGMPRESIKFMHEATSDEEKGKLFAQCRDGRVNVIIGSTERMGVGANIQTRAIAEHHLDVPWRPADVTQREGRILRQGNQNPDISIYRYVTLGSFDAYMWQTVARKSQFIDQVLTNRMDVREIDNLGEAALQYAEMAAIASGDMRILRQAKLTNEFQKLTRSERAFNRQVTANRARLNSVEARGERLQHERIALEEKILPNYHPTQGELFEASFIAHPHANPITFTNRGDLGEQLAAFLVDAHTKLLTEYPYLRRTQWERELTKADPHLKIGGVEWSVMYDGSYQPPGTHKLPEPALVFRLNQWESTHFAVPTSQFENQLDPAGAIDGASIVHRIEMRVNDLPKRLQQIHDDLIVNSNESVELRALALAPWPKQDELVALSAELEAIKAELAAEAAPPVSPEQDEQAPTIAPSNVVPDWQAAAEAGVFPSPQVGPNPTGNLGPTMSV